MAAAARGTDPLLPAKYKDRQRLVETVDEETAPDPTKIDLIVDALLVAQLQYNNADRRPKRERK